MKTPQENKKTNHIYHQYTILHAKRAEIQIALQQADIASTIYYPLPLHRQALLNNQSLNLSLPNTEMVSQQCLSLPMFPELTIAQVEQVCDVIHKTVI